MATDPVCKMNVRPAKAAAKAEYAGQIIISAPRPATRRLTPSHTAAVTRTADHTITVVE
jgi:hypothetical protein